MAEELDTSDISHEDDDEEGLSMSTFASDADEEWAESIRQLELLLSVVLVPFIGKYFGRRFAFFGMEFLAQGARY